jgi:hypothetical protein
MSSATAGETWGTQISVSRKRRPNMFQGLKLRKMANFAARLKPCPNRVNKPSH